MKLLFLDEFNVENFDLQKFEVIKEFYFFSQVNNQFLMNDILSSLQIFLLKKAKFKKI